VSGGLTVPGGDPGELESLADALEVLGAETENLGASTRQTAGSIRSGADWTGEASDSFGAFADNLSQGAGAAQGPLEQMAAAVRRYAGYLRAAQEEAQASTSLAQAAQDTGLDSLVHDSGFGPLVNEAQIAEQNAMDALQALQEAGDQAAAEVTSAAGDLDNLFGKQGPVQGWINTQPGLGEEFLFGRGILGNPGEPIPPEIGEPEGYPLLPDLGLPGGDPIEPDLGLPGGDPIEPDLGLPEGDPIEPEIGLGESDPFPPGLLRPLINYDSPSSTEEGAEGTPGFGPDGEPAPADDVSNLIRPPVDGDTRYRVFDPNDPDRPLTDIDSIEDGALVEDKSATGQHPDMNIPEWIEENVTTKLYKYDAARQYLPGYENAPIKLVFTEPGATPQFQTAVEEAVSDWQAANPGVQVSVEWTP
jgi:uncharacterized protein YukE